MFPDEGPAGMRVNLSRRTSGPLHFNSHHLLPYSRPTLVGHHKEIDGMGCNSAPAR